jgi:hypothetical protein
MKDRLVRPGISGSAALFIAARDRAVALGRTLSGHLDALLREDLAEAGIEVPPPLPMKRNGPRPKRGRRA